MKNNRKTSIWLHNRDGKNTKAPANHYHGLGKYLPYEYIGSLGEAFGEHRVFDAMPQREGFRIFGLGFRGLEFRGVECNYEVWGVGI